MKKNIILVIILIINLIIIGFLIYQNIYINTKFNEIDKNLEILFASKDQQDLQISQLTNNIIEAKQDEALQNLEKGTDESIFENTSTEGLTPITKEEAKNIWEEYLTNNLSEDLDKYDIDKIEKVEVKPNNRFTCGSASNFKTADFEREAYLLKYVRKDNLGEVTGYVDIYTGKIIAGEYKGD